MERVAIIGSGGAGKSTLARELGEATGLPVVHLDREHWQPGWLEPPRDEWAKRVEELASADRWIIDGNYGGTMQARLARADTVVFLDFSRVLCTYRVLKRSIQFRNRPRPDMTPGCNERIDPKFLKWVWQYPATRREGILRMLAAEESQGKQVRVLRNPAEVRKWLAAVAAGRG